jgi:radical SAM protein with 4Fe4S-binding SPASM domain
MSLRTFVAGNRALRALGAHIIKRNRLFRSAIGQACYRRYIEYRMVRLAGAPPFVHIETTNVCNARCTMCSYPIMGRPKGYMADALYAKILEDCAEMGVRRVNLQFLGEPLLDRRICERIRAAKQYGLYVQMVSNASMLDQLTGRALIAAGLDELRISMDGFSKESFERIRVGLKFDRIKQNVLRFLALRAEDGESNPRVVMTLVGLPENQAEQKHFYKFWARKADLVIIAQAVDWAGQVPLLGLGPTYTTNLQPMPCNHLWEEMIVLHDGTVTVCCASYDGQIVVGNATRQSLAAIWNGPRYQELRRLHQENRANEIPYCRTCKYYPIW